MLPGYSKSMSYLSLTFFSGFITEPFIYPMLFNFLLEHYLPQTWFDDHTCSVVNCWKALIKFSIYYYLSNLRFWIVILFTAIEVHNKLHQPTERGKKAQNCNIFFTVTVTWQTMNLLHTHVFWSVIVLMPWVLKHAVA